MNRCIECNHKFSINDRFKSSGYLNCPNCNSKYKPKVTVLSSVYTFGAFYFTNMLWKPIRASEMLDFLLYMVVLFILLKVYHLLPHWVHRYSKID